MATVELAAAIDAGMLEEQFDVATRRSDWRAMVRIQRTVSQLQRDAEEGETRERLWEMVGRMDDPIAEAIASAARSALAQYEREHDPAIIGRTLYGISDYFKLIPTRIWLNAIVVQARNRLAEASAAHNAMIAKKVIEALELSLACGERLTADETRPATWRAESALATLRYVQANAQWQENVRSGLKQYAETRGVTAAELIASLGRRALALERVRQNLIEQALAELKRATEEEAKRRREEAERQKEERMRTVLDRIVRRTPQARQSVLDFYARIDTGNVQAARQSLNELQRLDGGVDPQLQEIWAEAARSCG